MIVTRFRSMGLAAGAAASVLCCYMVSLRVASERGEVERTERQIAEARRDIRQLTIEISTRGQIRQLERWNADVLSLSAPRAAQFLNGEVELASYNQKRTPAANAKVVPAVVEPRPAPPALPPQVVPVAYQPAPAPAAQGSAALLHTAAYVQPAKDEPAAAPAPRKLLSDDIRGFLGKEAANEKDRPVR